MKKRSTKIFLILLLVIIVTALIVGILVPAIAFFKKSEVKIFDNLSNKHINYTDRTLISAHRAGGDLAPEETLSAFKLCMTSSYEVDVVEFDLHITKDDKLILLHDDTVNRTSNATEAYNKKKVYAIDLTFDELKSLNFGENFIDPEGNTPYKGLRGEDIPDDVKIMSLNEILDYLTGIRPNLQYIIEIKNGGKDGERAMDILYQTMLDYGILDKTIVGTFKNNVTKYIDNTYPNVTRSASILEVLDFYMSYLWGVKKTFKFNVLQIPKGGFIYDFGSKGFINYAHERDIAVQYWTINDADDAKRLEDNGADCVMTDNPKAIYEAFNQ